MSFPPQTPKMEPKNQNQNLPHIKPSGSLTSMTQTPLNTTNVLNTSLSASTPVACKRRLIEVNNGYREESIQSDEQDYFKSFPPGFRFNPRDEELVLHYLRKKVKNEKLPPNQMVEVDLYKHNPEFLAERYKAFGEDQWYFFTPRDRKYRNGTRPKRSAGDGYWKATGADKHILHNKILIGYRKALVFYKGKPPKGDKTNWIMHEFRVSEASTRTKTSPDDMRLDDWVLCRIYKKPDKAKDNEDFDESREEEDNDHDHDDGDDGGNEHMDLESRSSGATLIDPSCTVYVDSHGSDYGSDNYVNPNFSGGPEPDYASYHHYVNQTCFSSAAYHGGAGPELVEPNRCKLPPQVYNMVDAAPPSYSYTDEDMEVWMNILNLGYNDRPPQSLDFSHGGQVMPWNSNLPYNTSPSDPPNKPS